MKPALRFAIREIKEQAGLTYSGPVPVEEFVSSGLFGDARPEEPCTLDLEFSVGGSQILMEGRVGGRWLLPCSRCLAVHPEPFSWEMEETYPLEQEFIDVEEDVRQALVLCLPQRSLCRQDCKGLCARCGANLNEGPCRCSEASQQAGTKEEGKNAESKT
ncbi:MAG: DUF177 domain-containing protein [Elusimicrobia bacterium]|nr:DUF177 domain-containing protein [Elusimicrobiota bacterium]